MTERRTSMGFWTKLINFLTPMSSTVVVNKVAERKLLKQMIKEATLDLEKFDQNRKAVKKKLSVVKKKSPKIKLTTDNNGE